MKKTAAFLMTLAMLGANIGVMPAGLLTASAEAGDHNSQETAAVLTAGTAFEDTLIAKDEANWYKLTTEEDGSFTLNFEHDKLSSSTNYWIITAYQDNDGKLKEFRSWNISGSAEKTTTDTLGVPAGEYYIKVTPYSTSYYSDTTYKLTANFTAGGWETEFNDTEEAADVISVNETCNGLLHNAADVDWYTFATDEDGSFTVDFVHDSLDSSSSYWVVTVYQDNAGKLKEFRSWNIAGNAEKTTTNTLGVPAGNYYIAVKAYNSSYHSTVPYALTVNFGANGNEAKNDWESEFNNSSEDADQINVNQTYNGLLHNSADVDWYTFSTETDGSFSLRFEHDRIDSSVAYWTLTIYQYENEKLKKFATWNVAGNNEKYTTCTLGVPAGDYYVEVAANSSSYYSTSPYELTVNFTANADNAYGIWETEFNDYQEDADPISVNQDYNGTIYFYEDTDWYTFTANSDTTLTLRFEHDRLDSSVTHWIVDLYKGGSKLNSWNISGNEALTLSDEIEAEAGEYYIKVSGYNSYYYSASPYTLRVNSSTDPTPDDPGTTEPSNPSGGLFGDVDGDGAVNSSDATWILIYAAEVGAGNTSLPLDQWIATQL